MKSTQDGGTLVIVSCIKYVHINIYIYIYIYLLYTLSTSHEQKNTLLMLQIFALKVAGRLSIDPMWVLRQVSYMPAPCAALSALTTVWGVARLPVREKLNKLHHGSDIIIIKVEYEVIMKTPSKKNCTESL